ncbi:MAG: multimeric flavodoxin WrbA [Firmicutes bacterium]|nr:multimeric flavodoxin WrbA [Bacillota bacterium]
MNVIAFNGSPRKNGNTAILLNNALQGSLSQGAKGKCIDLYDLNYKGCVSCFACKLIGGKSYGKCTLKDELTSILDEINNADAIILGSPIYFGAVTGEMRSFLERLIFPSLVYDTNHSSLFKKKILTGFIFTMGRKETAIKEMGYDYHFGSIQFGLEKIFGSAETLCVTDTYQFDDYSKYYAPLFNAEEKAQRRKEKFPEACKQAFEMGVRFANAHSI